MSIRMKLLLSYAAMLVIPLVLIALTALLLTVLFRGDLKNMRNAYDTKTAMMFGNHETGRYFSDMVRTARNNPAQLTDPDYLQEIDEELHRINAALMLRIGDRLAYLPQELRSNRELLGALPKFKHPGEWERVTPIRSGNEILMLTHYDFSAPGQQKASLFLVTRLHPMAYFAIRTFPILFVAGIAILVLTHMFLTYFMSKSIIRPLQKLKNGANRIKEGNLELPVGVTGKDEIGQLGVAFEEMRVQLRDSIRIQQQYEANRKELIANISHDLKTPITAIKGYVDGITEGVADTPEKTERYVRTIASKAEQLDRLIDELFLYSKLDLNRLPFHFEPVNFRSFLIDWMEEVRFELEKKGFRVETGTALQEGVTVMIDRDKFKRVLSNIIGNCVKYMDKEAGQVRLRAYEPEGFAALEICDNGRGIEPHALPHIFERFYRADESRNAQTGGSGLGLAIAKQIIDGHGGTIRAESTAGEGTCITILMNVCK